MMKMIPMILKNLGIKKLFKIKKEEASYKDITCKNCETFFDGKFCPECGQSVKDYDKPFSFIFYNFVGDFFAFDTRFFRTFIALLFKPGFLSKEYFDGKRITYAPPFRIFIFVSFILFLLLQTYTNKGLTTVLDSDLKNAKIRLDSTSLVKADSIFSEVKIELDSTEAVVADSFLNQYGLDLDSVGSEDINLKINMETFKDTRDLRQVLNKYANELETQLETEEDPKERAKKRELIRLCRSPEQATAKVLEHMSWAFFLLLPIFALILKLVYIRRKHNYMRHLIFSIHIHSFIFLVMIIIVAMYMIFKGNLEIITSLLFFAIPVYFVIALKRFYGQKIGKIILKFLAISLLYNIIFWIVSGYVFLEALRII